MSVSIIRVTRAIYRLAREGRPSVYISIESNKILEFRSLVLSRGELLSNEKLRLGPSSSIYSGKADIVTA